MKLLILGSLLAVAAAAPGQPWQDVPCPTATVEKYVSVPTTAYVTVTSTKVVPTTVTATVTSVSVSVSVSKSVVYSTVYSTVVSTYTAPYPQKTWGDWSGK